jgi:hypothetical protein
MEVAEKKVAVASRPRKSGTAKKSAKKGTSKLRRAADRTVAANSTKIAETLLDGALKGHLMSTRLLIDLANGEVGEGEEEPTRRLCSWAGKLAAEPEWNGEKEALE